MNENPKILIVPVSTDEYLFNSASERFRCDWLKPYLNADKYNGLIIPDDYDVIIYQKAYLLPISFGMMMENQDKLQIFDVTDAEWLFRPEPFKRALKMVDVITASTEPLAQEIRKLTDKPVYTIEDGHELSHYKVVKNHEEVFKPTLVWFGYAGNINRIDHLLDYIQNEGYKLITICEKPVLPFAEFVPWDINTYQDEIIKGDIVLNPPDAYGFKSNNKTVTSWLLGMPVAKIIPDIIRFKDYGERVKESNFRIKFAKDNFDIRKSAEEFKKIIIKHKKYDTYQNAYRYADRQSSLCLSSAIRC